MFCFGIGKVQGIAPKYISAKQKLYASSALVLAFVFEQGSVTFIKDKWIYRDEIDLGPEEMRVSIMPDSNVGEDIPSMY